MALAMVQSVKASGTSVFSLTTAGITTTTGNLLVADISMYTVAQFSSFVDNNTLTWQTSIAAFSGASSGGNQVRQLYSENITGRSGHTFTINGTTEIYPSICVKEISGVATSGALDKTASNSTAAATTSQTSGATATTTQADEICCGVGGTDNVASSYTSTGGYTTDQTQAYVPGAFTGLISSFLIVSAVGAQTFTFTSSAGCSMNCAVATFKAATAVGFVVKNGTRMVLTGVGV